MTYKELSRMGFWEAVGQYGGSSFLGTALAWLVARMIYGKGGCGCGCLVFIVIAVAAAVAWWVKVGQFL